MQIEVYEDDAQLVSVIELDASPPIGSILKFKIPSANVVDRYRVLGVEYVFSTDYVGSLVKTTETRLVEVWCLVKQISANRGG